MGNYNPNCFTNFFSSFNNIFLGVVDKYFSVAYHKNMDNPPQGIGSKTGILMLIGLFILTAVFASASVFLIKKRVQEKKQQPTAQIQTPTPAQRPYPSQSEVFPIRPTMPVGPQQTAERPIATQSAQ